MAPSLRSRIVFLLLLVPLLLGCASMGPDVPGVPQSVSVTSPETERQALLLLLADRRLYEPIVVRESLSGDAALRRRLALTLARVADGRSLDPLLELLEDPSAEVRRAAAFGLGRLGDERSQGPLLRAAADPDREVGRQAVGAAAALGVPLRAVANALAAAGEDELWPRLLPELHRFTPAERERLERLGLGADDTEARAWAVYSLVQAARPGSADRLRALLADEDWRIRTWSAVGLGESGGRGDLDRLLPLLGDADGRVVAAALAAGRRLVTRGVVSPARAWRDRLVELTRDEQRRPVRAAALDAASAWLLDDELGPILVRYATSEDPVLERERERALLALASGGDPRAEELLLLASGAPSARVRLVVARGAGLLGSRALLVRLRDDPDPQVRGTVLAQELTLAMRSGGELDALHALLDRGLDSVAPAVRRAALEFLATTPLLPASELALAASDASVRFARVRLHAVRALEARAARVPEDAATVERELLRLAQDRLHVVRREAVRALEALGVEAPPPGPVETGRSVAVYQEILAQAAHEVAVRFETERGAVTVRLSCGEAPLSCVSFRQLAAQGFYDGLPFFFVVPWRLARAGSDPGGGPGFFVRDEMWPRSFDRGGLLGLVSDWPDGNAGEIVLTLAPQPSLDGEATFLGTVSDGLDVLTELVEGDRILDVREILP